MTFLHKKTFIFAQIMSIKANILDLRASGLIPVIPHIVNK